MVQEDLDVEVVGREAYRGELTATCSQLLSAEIMLVSSASLSPRAPQAGASLQVLASWVFASFIMPKAPQLRGDALHLATKPPGKAAKRVRPKRGRPALREVALRLL